MIGIGVASMVTGFPNYVLPIMSVSSQIQDRAYTTTRVAAPTSTFSRLGDIETMRGLACVLLVAYHVIGDDGTKGMEVDAQSWYRFAAEAVRPFRLPLFTFISGMVYAMRPVSSDAWWPFLRGKLRRLGVPLIVCTTVFMLADALMKGTPLPALGDLWSFYIFPFMHYWYLHALLLIFLAIILIDSLGWLKTSNLKGWITVAMISLGLYLLREETTHVFAVASALYLWPFFLAGIAMARFGPVIRTWMPARWMVVATMLLGGLWVGYILNAVSLPQPMVELLLLAIGISAAVALSLLSIEIGPLMLIGGYSYTIYLFHVFALAAMREVGLRLVGNDHEIIFVTGLMAGLGLPILFHRLIENQRLPRLLFLGRRY